MYNLRSAKNNTVELPVEIQLTGDTTFIETVLKNNFFFIFLFLFDLYNLIVFLQEVHIYND